MRDIHPPPKERSKGSLIVDATRPARASRTSSTPRRGSGRGRPPVTVVAGRGIEDAGPSADAASEGAAPSSSAMPRMLQLVADVWDALRGLQRRWVAFRVGRVRESQPATARLEDFDRDHPRLVANLQAVETKSKAYGPALRALARLGVLESNAPAERKAKAESELCSLLKVVLRAQKLERFVDRERLVILDDDIDVIAE